MRKGEIKDRVGEKWVTNEGYAIEIIEYISALNCAILFENGTIIKNRTYNDILRGRVKNPYCKSVLGVGFTGVGKYSKKNNLKSYTTWQNMLKRCYDNNYQESKPTYADCILDERWHNFQVFAEWCDKNYIKGFELDKDILVKGNKIYSPETCAFVPNEINMLLIKRDKLRGECPIGVSKIKNKFRANLNIEGKRLCFRSRQTPKEAFEDYKITKEEHIKNIANRWRGQITEQVYQALINYKVEIND